MIIFAVVAPIYFFGSNKNASTTISDNYGQHDEGSAMCHKGVNGHVSDAWSAIRLILLVKNRVDVQQAAEQLELLMDILSGLVFEVALQLTAQAIVAAL